MLIRSKPIAGNIYASPVYITARSNQTNSPPPDGEINALMEQVQLSPPPSSNNSNNNLANPNNNKNDNDGNFLTKLGDKAKSFIEKLPNAVKIGAGIVGTLAVGFVTYKGLKAGTKQLFRGNAPLGSSELKQSKRSMHSLREKLKEANEKHKALEAANPNTDYHWTDWFNPWWTPEGRKFIDAKAARKTIETNQAELQKTAEKYHQAYLNNKALATQARVEKRKKDVEISKQRLEEATAALNPIIKNAKEPKNGNAKMALDLAKDKLKACEARLKQARKIHEITQIENNIGFSFPDLTVSNQGLTWRGTFEDDADNAKLKAVIKKNKDDNSERRLKGAYGITKNVLASEKDGKWNPSSGTMKIGGRNAIESFGLRRYKPWAKPLEVLQD